MKSYSYILKLLILLFITNAVSTVYLSAQNTTPHKHKDVILQLPWLHQFQFAGYYAAKAKGFYSDAGLNVIIKPGKPEVSPIKEVVSRKADFGVARGELILHRLKGQPVVALAVIFQHSAAILLAKKSSGIYSPQHLIGKKVMLLAGNESAEYIAIFKNEGISLKQLNIIPSSLNIKDLINGKTDVFDSYLSNEPYYLQEKGIPYTIILPRNYGIDFYGDTLFTSEEKIEADPDEVKAFRKATIKGWEYAMNHTDEIIDLIIKEYNPKKTKEHLTFEAEALRSLMLPKLIEIGHMNPGRWKHMADTYVSLEMVEPDYDIAGFIYEKHPATDKQLLRTILVIGTAVIVLIVTITLILFIFNKTLQSAVKKQTLKLQKSELKYKELIRMLNSGIIVHRADTSILLSNPKAEQLLGLTESQMRGKDAINPYWKFMRDDGTQLPQNEYPVSKVISSKKRISNMLLGIQKPKNNDITWVLVNGFPILDENNDLQQAIITFIDITEHKKTELELKKHRDNLENSVKDRTADLAKLTHELQTILDSVRATIWHKDTKNNIIKVNKAGAELVGMKVEDIEGHPSMELFPEVADKYYQDDLEVIQSGKPKLGIVEQLTTASGNKIWVLTDKIPFRDEAGNITGVIAFAIDITNRKKAEETLNERYAEVNNLNKAMINLLEDHEEAKNNLLKSQQQLEVTNKELESFSYSVSHDLRAPLRALDGFSQIILEDYIDKLDKTGKDYLQRISKASKRMGMLIDDLLRLSRISRAGIKQEKLNLSKIVNEIADRLTTSKPGRKVNFILQPNVYALGDPQLISIALENILGNAWKFTGKKKSAKIEFGTKKNGKTGKTVYFIKDNGAGFDMKYADKLFGAFQRLHSSEEFEGTGIGLATVNRIILRHQGTIWAESKINKGAAFYFRLNE